MRKIISLVLSAMLTVSMMSVAFVSASAVETDATYTVAGDAGLTGVTWDPAQNVMTNGEYTFNDATYDYAITFEDVAAGSYSFKVTDGTWNNSWGKDGQNYSIIVANTCPVTIYFDSTSHAIDVDADLSTFTLESVTAVGNGDGTWLNGAAWDLSDESNDMTEVEPGVWQITYENMDAFENYQVKFAVNHSWAYNWTSDGVFDGQTNPSNVVEEDGTTVTLTIDLNGFDFDSKSGNVVITLDGFATEVPTEATTEVTEETTVIPTEATTEATEETTVIPTEATTEATEATTEATEATTEVVTEATTEAAEETTVPATVPVTEPVTEPTTAPAIYTVAGDAGLTGVAWDPAMNEMTKGEYTFADASYDYSITFADVAAGSYSFKVTVGSWDTAWGKGDQNYSIILSDACPVTIYFNSDSKEIAVDAANLAGFVFESITLAGNGDGTWLNGASWDTTDESNDMVEVAPGVFEMVYTDMDAFENYQFKFSVNHSWTINWTSDGIFDGQSNPSNVVPFDGATVKITIDLNGYDFETGEGSVVTGFYVYNADGVLFGDVNNDGVISIDDATDLQRYLAGELAPVVEDVADYDMDGAITIDDVTALQRAITA